MPFKHHHRQHIAGAWQYRPVWAHSTAGSCANLVSNGVYTVPNTQNKQMWRRPQRNMYGDAITCKGLDCVQYLAHRKTASFGITGTDYAHHRMCWAAQGEGCHMHVSMPKLCDQATTTPCKQCQGRVHMPQACTSHMPGREVNCAR